MILAANAVRAKLAAGRRVAGSVVYSWSPAVADVAGFAGLDYLRIDTEHAWRRDSSLEALIRAAIQGGVVPIVRVDRDDPYLVRKVLELGAGGIIVPDVCSAEEAESVVRAAKFPPRGERGYSGNCWSAGWGAHAGEGWVSWSNREPLIGVMIENIEAMDRIDAIVAVDGVDFVLFGPADFSMSLGLPAPKASDPRVQAAIEKTIEAAHSAGKFVSLGVGTDSDDIRRQAKRGVDMLELGNDLGLLRSAWKAAVSTLALEDDRSK